MSESDIDPEDEELIEGPHEPEGDDEDDPDNIERTEEAIEGYPR
jgi:hypothetical protein